MEMTMQVNWVYAFQEEEFTSVISMFRNDKQLRAILNMELPSAA